MTSGEQNLHAEVLESAEILEEILAAGVTPDSDAGAVSETLEWFANAVERIAAAADDAGWVGLRDACLLQCHALNDLVERNAPLSPEQCELLHGWPGLVSTYVGSPDDREAFAALIGHLQDSRWPVAISADDADMLVSVFELQAGEQPRSTGDLDVATSEPAATTGKLSALCWSEPVIESLKIMNALLAERAAHRGVDGTDSNLLHSYLEQVEHIGAAADEADMVGLRDVGLMFQELLLTLQDSGKEPTPGELELMQEWPELVASYAADPDNAQTRDGLIAHLQDKRWSAPLPDEDANMLRGLLGGELDDHEGVAEGAPISVSDEAPLEAPPEAPQDVHPPQPARALPDVVVVDGELVALLRGEMDEIVAVAADPLACALGEPRVAALERFAGQIERFAGAAEAAEFSALYQMCAHVQNNVLGLAADDAQLGDPECDLLRRFPTEVLAYLDSLGERPGAEALVSYLGDPAWPLPLSEDEAAELVEVLAAITVTTEKRVVDRPTQGQPADVSLELPADVNPELLDGLLQELPGQTADFTAAVARIVDGSGAQDDVDIARRVAHTVKGAGNTVGVRGIAVLTHHVEDILSALAQHNALPTPALGNTLMNAADCLESMSEALLGLSDPPGGTLEVLQEVLDWANYIDREGIPTAEEESAPKTLSTMPKLDPVRTANKDEAERKSSPNSNQATESPDASVPMLRVPASLVDNLLRLVGETIILNGQLKESLNQSIQETQSMREHDLLFQRLTSELEQLVDVRGITGASGVRTVNGDFDALEMDQYNELHTCTRRLVEAATDAREQGLGLADHLTALDGLLETQSRLNRETQESVLRTRMVPVKQIEPRLQRAVRQTCRLTDKECHLHVSGLDTLVDSNVLSGLVDPLMHVLRNAVDHGIEAAERRVAQGKPAAGRIDLEFTREGNNIVVRCRDDGAGLNLARIREQAITRGLLGADDAVSEDELTRFILTPGFSTRDSASQTSGRGIGLDIVNTQLLAMKGSLNISFKPGRGCLMELRLPVTLLSAHALLVRVREQIFAVSSHGVEKIVYAGVGETRDVGGQTLFQEGRELYEARPIDGFLSLGPDRRENEGAHRSALLVRELGSLKAVMVEEVIDSRDVVIKNLGPYLPEVRGVVGATILGDGSVAPVLDLPALLRQPAVVSTTSGSSHELREAEAPREAPAALVVDDSLSARRSVMQVMHDAGYDVRGAMDGVEAMELLETKQPDVLLVDMEMPRMNGLELTSHVRARAESEGIPIIMITSRSTEKHRREALSAGVDAYLNKPFSEDELLEHVQTTARRG